MAPRARPHHREALSLLLSVLAHAALLATFTWLYVVEAEPEEERILEVEWLPPLEPAPLAAELMGPVSDPSAALAPRPLPAHPPHPAPAAVRAARIPEFPGPTERLPLMRVTPPPRAPDEPIVECRVRIASLDITYPPRDPRRPWLEVRDDPEATDLQPRDPTPERAPKGPRTLEQAAEAVEQAAEVVTHREPERPAPERPAPKHTAPEHAAPGQPPPDLDHRTAQAFPFVPHDHGAESTGGEAKEQNLFSLPLEGDPRLLDSIQARIDAVSPLVHATAPGCRHHRGTARLRFLINPRGYPRGYQLIRSTGSACLDAHLDEVLHLAEPYPRSNGWVPVYVRFDRRADQRLSPSPEPAGPSSSGSSTPSSSRPATPQGML